MAKSLFYKIYFSVIAVFAVLLIIGLVLLSGWLGSYEASRPEKIVENLIENYLSVGKLTEMREEFSLKLSYFETNDSLKPFYEENLKGKEFTYASISKKGDNFGEGYGISADGKRILNLYLKKDGNKYSAANSEFAKEFYTSVRITLPKGAEVFVNGNKINAEICKNLDLPTLPTKYQDNSLNPKQVCVIEQLLNKNVTVSCNKEYNVPQYPSGDFSVSSNIEQEIIDFAVNAAKTYACYLQKDADIAALSSIFATDTPFYRNVVSSYITYVAEHTEFRFDNLEISEQHRYSESLYSCRIKMKHVLVSKTGEEHFDYFDKNVYIYKNGNKLKAIDMQNFS